MLAPDIRAHVWHWHYNNTGCVFSQVFHGAARLVQPGQATNVPTGPHTAVRRAFNADITKETKNNVSLIVIDC